MNGKLFKRPELLAPAGDAASALAAFDAGADAVYAGLSRFNARERNPNFDFDAMARLIGYAHERGRRVYIAFNTLLRETELPEAAEYLYRLTQLQPDAVIVQDLGLIRIARKYFPTLHLHGSTQMGIHNSAGVETAGRLGLDRVILERQVTMAELALLMRKTELEIEVFVHGALCCSLSGVCLFSSWLGGWSGNRGKCKQSCRREYTAGNRRGNYFSPADLCLIDRIPELCRLGVASLKIEGRLRRADYVRNAVAAYRLAVDAAAAGEEVPEDARRILRRAGGRTWSSGFLSAASMADLIQAHSPGVAGQPAARVEAVGNDGIVVKVTGRLHRGDRVRLPAQGNDDEPVFTLTAMTDEAGQPTVRLVAGQRGWLKAPPDKITVGATIYKVGESCAAATDAVLASYPVPRHRIKLEIAVGTDAVSVRLPDFPTAASWQLHLDTMPAKSRPLQPETVQEEFRTRSSTRLEAGEMTITVAPELFIPAGELKRARQEFWRWADRQLGEFELNSSGAAGLAGFAADYAAATPPAAPELTPACCGARSPAPGLKVVLPDQWTGAADEEILLPYFGVEDRLPELRRQLSALYRRGARRFRVTSLFHFALLRELPEVQLTSSHPLPAANSQAAALLGEWGCRRVQAWLEIGGEDLEAMRRKAPVTLEYYRYGRPPLLITRAEIPVGGWIGDSRRQRFEVIKEDGLTLLLPPGPMAWPELPGVASFADYRHVLPDDRPVGDFNYSGRWA